MSLPWARREALGEAPEADRSRRGSLRALLPELARPAAVAGPWVIGVVAAGALLYGVGFALLAPELLAPLTAPLLLLALTVIWALPDTRKAPERALAALLFAFAVSVVMWPNYLAIAPPGLPWITMVRLTGFPLVLVLLLCVSTSRRLRTQSGAALRAVGPVWRLLVAFTIVAAVSIALSADPGLSFDRFIVAQTGWTAIFFASVGVFLVPGRAWRMIRLMWAMAIVVGVIAIIEWRAQHILWADHIPSFLKVEDDNVLLALAGAHRLSGVYRAQSTFTTPLGLGEYMALTLPFVGHYAVVSRNLAMRALAVASAGLILLVTIASGARLGVIGCLLGALLYVIAWALLKWRRERTSLLGTATVLAYPVMFLGAIAASFFVGRIHNVVWGDGSQDTSNQARIDQWIMGIPKVLSHPEGYGIGMGATTLGYHPYDITTIDNYYLCVMLEVGIAGFIFYYGMLALSIYYSAKTIWKRKSLAGEAGLLAPIAIALTIFFIEKSVFSEQDNHPLVFMLMGMIAALVARSRREENAGAAKPAQAPALSGPPAVRSFRPGHRIA